jgi:phosphoglycerate kinase
MTLTAESMTTWLQTVLGVDPSAKNVTLEQYLSAIGRLESLANVPKGTPVLVRGDLDAKPGAKVGEGDIRLRSMLETLKFGQQKGWIQVIFGHIGRKPEGSLSKVRARLAELLGAEVTFIADWFDPATNTIKDEVTATIKKSAPGSFIMLENTRKYDMERLLWKAKGADIPKLAPVLASLANEFATKVAKVYVNEAFSAGSLDSSTTVVPAAMERVALGLYVAEQFDKWIKECLAAQMVVFSGLKADKLDDMEAMINRGKIRWVMTAGSLAMALKKAATEVEGHQFTLGVAEDPANKDQGWYIPPERIAQAKRMIAEGRKKGIEFVLPVDFVLQDGKVSTTIGPGQQQFDVGPATSALYAEKVEEFLASQKAAGERPAVFFNGVFGMFEDPRFEDGTRKFIAQLKRLTDAGARVYVGGGEGGTALEKYGKPTWITYCFTAGGTVLNALGSDPVPYLVALKMASKR